MPASNQLMDTAAVTALVTAGTWSWSGSAPGLASNLIWDWGAFLTYLTGSGSHGASTLCPDYAAVSAWATVTPPPAPAAPSSASVGSATTSGLTASWSWSGSNLTGFKVYRSTSSSFGSASVVHTGTSTSESSWGDSGLSQGTTYYYWVSAYGPGGESSATSAGSGTTLVAAPGSTPTGVSVSAATNGTVAHVSWSWGGGSVSGFRVYRNRNGAGYGLYTSTSGSGTSYDDGSVSDGDTVQYEVAAYNGGGDGPTSSASSSFSVVFYPGTPSSLHSTGNTTTTEDLAWSYSGVTVTGFKIYRDGSLVATQSGTGTTYTDTGLSAGTGYSWTVKAYRTGAPDSSASNTLTDTTSSGTLSIPSLTSVTNGTYQGGGGIWHYVLAIGWTNPDSSASTHIEYKASGAGSWSNFGTDTGGSGSDNIGTGGAGTFDVRIRAQRTGWTSSGWAEVDGTSVDIP